MSLATDIRKSVIDTTAVYAMVGLTDLTVEKVRTELEHGGLQAKAQHAPTAAVMKTLEAAGRAEETYDDLAARGKHLVDRIKRQRTSQDLVTQGKVTLARGKAAVTTVRRGAGDTGAAGQATVSTAQHAGRGVAEDTRKSAAKRTAGTKSAAKRTAATARKRTSTTRSTTKAATTSARKTAAAAAKATEAAATKVGD